MSLRTIWISISGLIAPGLCAACGRGLFSASSALCPDCSAALELFGDPRCRKCGRSVPKGAAPVCGNCASVRKGVSFLLPCGPYRGVLREAVLALKLRGFTALSEDLSSLMADLLQRDGRCLSGWVLVPVPLSPLSWRNRGYNHAALLARGTARKTGLPVLSGVLRKTRETARQSELSRLYRLRNVRRAFEADEAVRGENVLLVDDVVTTGATAEACAAALKEKGARRVAVLCAALTLPEDSPRRNR